MSNVGRVTQSQSTPAGPGPKTGTAQVVPNAGLVPLSAVTGLVPLKRDAIVVSAISKARSPMTLNVKHLEAQITTITGMAPTAGNKVQLYVDGRNAYPQIMNLINNAQKSLHLEMYIFKDDKASWDVAEALAARSASGVKVRVMADWQGSPTGSEIFDFMRQNGVDVRHFTAQSLKNPTQVDHRKIIVADGQKAITGGMNIADTYRESWHDAIVTVEGPAGHDMQATFL
ncbi:MAG: hypothetical protein H7338_19395, partial [Candidatus Sericytochromatia bacterium]|nr:hypothetical protein [Candidatus Sericytochromatia bacterium]